MFWILRTIMIWLLVLALPAQGLATVVMAGCKVDHHASELVSAAPHHPAGGSLHGDRDPGHQYAQAHHHDGQADAQHADPLHPQQADPAPTAQAAKTRCGDCGPCCSSAAVLDLALQVPEAMPTPAVFVPLVPRVEKFAIAGPDRPPRALLA
jgi:hypothetical protein